MCRNIRMFSFVGVSIGICFLTILINHFYQPSVESQTVFAHTEAANYIYLPLMKKPFGPEYKIVFSSDRNQIHRVNDIYTMNLEGKNIQNLTNTPDISEDRPIWSPDGTMITYYAGEENKEELYVMNADGSNKRNLSNSPTTSEKNPVWSPDSKKIGFISDRDDQAGIYDVFVVNVDGTGLTNLTNSSDADEWSMDWSPDGSKIVYLADKSLHPISLIGHIVTMNANGSNKQTIFTDIGFNYNPVWTPDGSKITFNFFSGCLAMIDADGSNLARCFTAPPELDGMEGFKWNNTGAKLAYVGFFNQNSSRLYIYDSTTNQSIDITPNIVGFYPDTPFSWTQDNRQIIVGENGYGADIAIINEDGSGYKNLTNSDQDEDLWPNLSPIALP